MVLPMVGPAAHRTKRRKASVGIVDVAASAFARLAPAAARPRIDQARRDLNALVGRFPEPGAAPRDLDAIDPVEELLPRFARLRWVTLKTDLTWLARDLRGEKRPVLVPQRRRSTGAEGNARPGITPRPLRVEAVERETDDALTFTLADPSGAPIAFEAGQFLTLHLQLPDSTETLRRAYSLSSSPLDGPRATITVKRIEGGRGSSFLHDAIAPGATLRVLGPSGSFVMPECDAQLVMIAGGSGITPVSSIVHTVLRTREASRVSLLYGNRRRGDVIFARRLEALAHDHADRFELSVALEEPPEDFSGTVGRLDPALLEGWLDGLGPETLPRRYYLCGPAAMMDGARATLLARGVPKEAIHEERFQSPDDPSAAGSREVAGLPLPSTAVTVQLRVGGRDYLVPVQPGETLLEAGLGAGAPMPFSCAMGGCAACKGKLVSGEVRSEEPNCLLPAERAEGFVLTCCSRPLGPARVEIP